MVEIETVVVGARGYTGSALLPLLYRHPHCQLQAVGSTRAAGKRVTDLVAGLDGLDLAFADIQLDRVEQFPARLYILALPNGESPAYVQSIERFFPEATIIDLAADFRFDADWVYGLPERFRDRIAGARRIANPGCYATGAQLALAPLADQCAGTPVVFGVSGYSGAGQTPSRRNDRSILEDNLLPYALVEHVHEREASHHLGRDIRFLPHVASFFRGINLTIAVELSSAWSAAELEAHFRAAYADSPLIRITPDIPEVAMVRDTHGVLIGGFCTGRRRPAAVSLVCVLDNLLKGAATQAVQNMNLAFGLPELTGLLPEASREDGGR